MELPGVNYLYALATVSITFVGFSALLPVFRETIGGGMTSYDSYFTLSFMQAGFIVTAGALLPQLPAFYEISHTSVWRTSTLIMAVPIFLFVAKVPGQRRTAAKESIPFYVGLLLLLQFLAGAYLLLNAVGWPAPPNLAPFALALTVMLFTTGIAYLIALARALRGDRDPT
jgi:archaellum biogenesis protein FlaJ (TadC family)